MSMNKKYTWADFLKSHPEHKEKKIKRTSKEGEKAFEAAFKQHLKEYLKNRLGKIDKECELVEKRQKALSKSLKEAKKIEKKNHIQQKIGAAGSYLRRLEKMRDRTKTSQKSL